MEWSETMKLRNDGKNALGRPCMGERENRFGWLANTVRRLRWVLSTLAVKNNSFIWKSCIAFHNILSYIRVYILCLGVCVYEYNRSCLLIMCTPHGWNSFRCGLFYAAHKYNKIWNRPIKAIEIFLSTTVAQCWFMCVKMIAKVGLPMCLIYVPMLLNR